MVWLSVGKEDDGLLGAHAPVLGQLGFRSFKAFVGSGRTAGSHFAIHLVLKALLVVIRDRLKILDHLCRGIIIDDRQVVLLDRIAEGSVLGSHAIDERVHGGLERLQLRYVRGDGLVELDMRGVRVVGRGLGGVPYVIFRVAPRVDGRESESALPLPLDVHLLTVRVIDVVAVLAPLLA